jgi:phage minor structural protein
MIPILYESTETAFASNGLGRLRDCISCKVTEERNGIFECDFEYPVDGANYDMIQCGRIIGVTHDETGDVEPFDIVSYSKPISGVVSFHAVHISYRQRGIVARGTNINSLADAFAVLTSSAQPSNPFTYSADFTSTAYASSFDGTPRSVRQFLGGIEGSILDAYGGEYEFDRFRVILHQSRGQLRDFVIRYGVNLLDYKDDTDYSETYTSCVPYWRGNDNGQDVTVVGSRVDLGGTAYNGQNVCAALDLSDKFQDKPTASQLESFALSLMQSKQTNLPAQNIAVDFVRLQDMGYEGLDTLLQCNLCDSIKVEFPRYGMSGTYKIVKTVWDVLADKYDSMELGQLSTTLAEALGIQSQTDTLQSIDDLTVNDLNVTGGAAIAGALTVGGAEVKPTVYRDFNSPSFTTTTGAVGSYMMLMDVNVALNGYVPVSVTLCGWAHVSYIPMLIIQNSTTVRIILLRNGSGAATYTAGDFKFRVHYLKS